MKSFFSGRIIVKVGNIIEENVDVIVNAANSTLMGGGGVDGAIHRAGGDKILEECKELRNKAFPNGLPTGEAVITSGGKLKTRFIIHTVGPIYGDANNQEEKLLTNCYWNSLQLAREKNCNSISFPSISTGVYHFPKEKAAQVVGKTLKNYIDKFADPDMIDLVFYSEHDFEIFIKHCGW